MIGYRANPAAMFFDRKAVTGKLSAAKRKAFSKLGAFTRTNARSRIRPAKQKTLADMSEAERDAYDKAVAGAKRRGNKKPKRPGASSKPGESPRSHVGTLRKLIYFGWDSDAESVVIGPALFRGKGRDAAKALEYGGTSTNAKGDKINIEARPTMQPALAAEAPKAAGYFADAIK